MENAAENEKLRNEIKQSIQALLCAEKYAISSHQLHRKITIRNTAVI